MLKTTRILSVPELTPEMLATWRAIQHETPELASPYYCVEYTQIVAAVSSDVRVAVLEDERGVAGFFPHQKGDYGVGFPVGGGLADYHGVVARAGAVWDADDLVRRCGLRTWMFGGVPRSQAPFERFARAEAASPFMDLSAGYAAYRAALKARGSTELTRKTEQKDRKLEREFGPVRFVLHSTDRADLDTMMRWKSAQYKATGADDAFARPWIREVLQRIHVEQSPGFAGVLSMLYVGNKPISACFNMRSATTLHCWFSSYDKDFAKYSPGIIIFLKTAERAAELGIKTYDFGSGDYEYKTQLMTGSVPLMTGAADISVALRMGRRAVTWARETPAVFRPLRWGYRRLRALRGLTVPPAKDKSRPA